MQPLRDHLAALSAHIPAVGVPPDTPPTRLACLSQTHIAVLQKTADSATLHIYPTSAAAAAAVAIIELPPDAHTLLPARDMLAVQGDRSLVVIDRPTSPFPPSSSSTATATGGGGGSGASVQQKVRPVAAPLFAARPGLRLRHAAWMPHAPGFLLILTTDAHLRLFDVLSRPSSDTERLRLRVVANAGPPVSFAFARGPDWHALAVYVLMSDGALLAVAPIAPIGTRIPRALWARLRARARAVIDAAGNTDGDTKHGASSSAAARALPLSPGSSASASWQLRQAHMQLRFLDHVFEPAAAGDLVAVREFKPAPLLFQGPLFIEHDDAPDDDSRHFSSLTALNCGADVPPVLLRAATDGSVSVLVALERVEPQWFLNADPTTLHPPPALPSPSGGAATAEKALVLAHSNRNSNANENNNSSVDASASTTGTDVAVVNRRYDAASAFAAGAITTEHTVASAAEPSPEYATCAEQVAPSLLCFEHLAFPAGPVSLAPLGGVTDADVLFAATPTAIHALRLSFISVMSNPDALERIPSSSITPLFSTAVSPTISAPTAAPISGASPASRATGTGTGTGTDANINAVLGLAPLYVAGKGPVAIALSADGRLHASAPLRWASDFDTALPPDLLTAGPSAAAAWAVERPRTGSRAFARADLAVEVGQTLERARLLSGDATTRVAAGTLGVVSQLSEFAPVLDELERRLAAMTGGTVSVSASASSPSSSQQQQQQQQQQQPGALDALAETSTLLATWAAALGERAAAAGDEAFEVDHAFARVRASQMEVQRKADRVAQSSAALEARLASLRRIVDRGAGQLSAAESGHLTRLRERRRRLVALRVRLDELAGAVSLQIAGASASDGYGGGLARYSGGSTATVRTSTGFAGGTGGGSGGMFGAMPDAASLATPPQGGLRRVSESPARRRLSAAFSTAGGSSFQTPVRDARRSSVNVSATGSPWRATEPPLARRRPEWSPRAEAVQLGARELMQIRAALEKHSNEIEQAMSLSTALWKRLSVT